MKFMKKNKDLPKVEPVKIKPLFGMKPGLWLTIAYALALLLLIFLVGFLPDMLDGSKRVTFTSAAGTAAVYVDDTYVGGTPFTRKIASGEHNVSYKVNGFEIDSFTVKVGHPVFFNWLFPRTQKVESDAALTEDAFKSLSAELLQDANAYSAILEYDTVHRYPNILTSYAKAISTSAYAKQVDALESALLFVTNDEMLKDADNAISILGINAVTPYQTLDGSSTVGYTMEEPELTAKRTSLKSDFFTLEGFTIPEADFSNGRSVKATYPEVKEAGQAVHTDEFNIGAYCVTEYQFAKFIEANPMWAASNKENLVAQGLVDDYYLDGVTISTAVTGNRPVRNVSWHAANAFCQWLSSVTGKEIYLPTEDQWIAASLTDSEGGYQRSLAPSEATISPAAMLGGVWEMTGTEFIPLSRVIGQGVVDKARTLLKEYDTPVDMVVKGGSYVLGMGSIDRYSVGTTYRSLCSDFMGFRIAWN